MAGKERGRPPPEREAAGPLAAPGPGHHHLGDRPDSTSALPAKAVARAILVARHPELGRLFAAVDGAVRFTKPGLRPSRLGALLAPFPSVEAAKAALKAAGAVDVGIQS